MEKIEQDYDYVTGRAVIRLQRFLPMVEKNLRGGVAKGGDYDSYDMDSKLGPGILYLKGGDLTSEIQELGFSPLSSRLDRWIPKFQGSQELLYFPARRAKKGWKALQGAALAACLNVKGSK